MNQPTYFTRSKAGHANFLQKPSPVAKNVFMIRVGDSMYCQFPVMEPKEPKRQLVVIAPSPKEPLVHEVRSRGGKKRRMRKNFEYPVKKRILDMYSRILKENSGQSIRTIAMMIYNTMSREE